MCEGKLAIAPGRSKLLREIPLAPWEKFVAWSFWNELICGNIHLLYALSNGQIS